MALPFKPGTPWLLYSYPWMPYPRRIGIYLHEKRISPELVQVVRVSDPQDGNEVVDETYPPRPSGSLPILAIPSDDEHGHGEPQDWFFVRQSMAIIHLLEEVCEKKLYGFSSPILNLMGNDLVQRVRIQEILSLAEECTVAWNPVRTFGTKAGTISSPEGSKEMLRWLRRSLMAIETWWQETDRDMSVLRGGSEGHATMADVVLYQFLEFTKDCYGVDMTIGSGESVKDVYGREVCEKFPKLKEFFEAFDTRDSTKRDARKGEVAGEGARRMMQTWYDGIW